MYIKSLDEINNMPFIFMLRPTNTIYHCIITIFTIIMSFVFWACFCPIDEIVRAPVVLRPVQPVSSIKCITSGEMLQKNFDNDDFVSYGDLLFSLDTTTYMAELEACINEEYKNNEELLENKTLITTMETLMLPESSNSQKIYMKSSLYLTDKKKYETNIKDINTKLEREKNKPSSLIIPQNIKNLENQLIQAELDYKSWKNKQQLEVYEQQKQLLLKKDMLESKKADLERKIKNSTIYAPITGRITEVRKLNIGDYILSGEEIVRIVPQNDNCLKAEIFIEPCSIVNLKLGDTVKIKCQGLPPSNFGLLKTKINVIPPDVSTINGQNIYIVEAIVEPAFLQNRSGKTIKLFPGITGEARIVTTQTTFFKMMLKKFDFIG